CAPFAYDKVDANAGGALRSVSIGYFSAPEDAMESPPLMQPWARQALAAALRARAAKPPAASPAKKARPRKGSASKAPRKA
ncbi:MAG TPA: competence protein TfoX, partial [Burkholderiaceae bacterium]|nr:competence protein TfoX [Burkholderiaceae bacterium]